MNDRSRKWTVNRRRTTTFQTLNAWMSKHHSLRGELVDIGTTLLVSALKEGLGEATPQAGEVTYAAKIDPAELQIDWTNAATTIDRLVRMGNAWTTHAGKRLKVWETRVVAGAGQPGTVDGVVVMCGDGALELVEVQPEGKPRRRAADWANGVGRGADLVLGA